MIFFGHFPDTTRNWVGWVLKFKSLHFPSFFPMFTKKLILAGALSCAAASATVLASMPAQAVCLTTTPGGPPFDNNCVTYNTVGSPVTATLHYSDNNLATDTYSQITLNTVDVGKFSGWSWSTNATTWTPFDPMFTVAPNTGGNGQISAIKTGTLANPYYLRATLSNTAPLNTPYSFTFLSNATGNTDSFGQLITGFGAGASMSRNFTRQMDPPPPAAPGPLPLMGAAFAFGYSRKIRKAIRTKV
jgi:hypothetical protein